MLQVWKEASLDEAIKGKIYLFGEMDYLPMFSMQWRESFFVFESRGCLFKFLAKLLRRDRKSVILTVNPLDIGLSVRNVLNKF